jgi:hypothetical protein
VDNADGQIAAGRCEGSEMNQIEHIMALADEYGNACYFRKEDYAEKHKVLRAAIEQALSRVDEPVAIGSNDEVERLAKQCGWDNRRYMTPADYQIWCDRMRMFASIAAPQPQREWVDLTPKEVRELFKDGLWIAPSWTIYQEISAKLREKNGGTK